MLWSNISVLVPLSGSVCGGRNNIYIPPDEWRELPLKYFFFNFQFSTRRDCVWTISTHPNNTLRVRFNNVNLGYGTVLHIGRGRITMAPGSRIWTLKGASRTPHAVATESNEVWVTLSKISAPFYDDNFGRIIFESYSIGKNHVSCFFVNGICVTTVVFSTQLTRFKSLFE